MPGCPIKYPLNKNWPKKPFYADFQLLIFKKTINFDPTVHLTFDGRSFLLKNEIRPILMCNILGGFSKGMFQMQYKMYLNILYFVIFSMLIRKRKLLIKVKAHLSE